MSRNLCIAIGLLLLVAGGVIAILWTCRLSGVARPAALAHNADAGPNTHETETQGAVAVEIDRIFLDLQEGRLHIVGPRIVSGWEMPMPSGGSVSRSILQEEADPIIAHGREAVPYLYRWVMTDNLAVRYVAVYSLERITGIQPGILTFDKEDQAGRREAAIRAWKAWLSARP
jgi:hypothetical protein